MEIEENEIQILKQIKEIKKKFAIYSEDWNAYTKHVNGESKRPNMNNIVHYK